MFILVFQRIRIVQSQLQQKTLSKQKKSDWSNYHAKKQITAVLSNASASIHKMSLKEIHSKWAAQSKYQNFTTNYKRMQTKIETNLSHPSIDSNHQNHTF